MTNNSTLHTILEAVHYVTRAYRVRESRDPGAVEAPVTTKVWTLANAKSKINGLIGKTEEQINAKTLFPAAFGKGVNWGQDCLDITQPMIDEINSIPGEDYRMAMAAGFASMCPVKMSEAQNLKRWESAAHRMEKSLPGVYEDAPGMAAGSGGIAGIGVGPQGEPGVMRRSRQNKDAANRQRWIGENVYDDYDAAIRSHERSPMDRDEIARQQEVQADRDMADREMRPSGKQLVPQAPALDSPRRINGSLRSESDSNIVVIPFGREKVLKSRQNIEKYIKSGRDVTLYGQGTCSITDFQPGSTLFYRYDSMRKRGSLKVPAQTEPWNGTESARPVSPQVIPPQSQF